MHKILAVVMAGMIGALMLTPAEARAAATVINESREFPVQEEGINPCTGEFFSLSGVSRTHFHATFDAADGSHLRASALERLSGTSQSGVLYEGRNMGQIVFSGDSAGVSAVTAEADATIHVVSAGAGDDFLINFRAKLTVTPEGDATVDRSNVSAQCLG